MLVELPKVSCPWATTPSVAGTTRCFSNQNVEHGHSIAANRPDSAMLGLSRPFLEAIAVEGKFDLHRRV